MSDIISPKEANCSNCKFSHMMPQDLNLRICKGAPPQAVLVPVPGGARMEHHFPLVNATNDACALHRFRVIDADINNV